MGTRKPLRWDGGVNLYADPRALKDGQLALAKNSFPTLEGILHKRESVQAIGYTDFTFPETSSLSIAPITIHVPDPACGRDFILHAHGGGASQEFLLATAMDSLVSRTGPDYQTLVAEVPIPAAQPACFVNYRGRTIVLGGQNEGFYQYVKGPGGVWLWVKASFAWIAGTAGVAAAQTQSLGVRPRAACPFQGRMVYANFGLGMGNWLCFADFNSTTHVNVTDAPLWAIVGSDVLAENGRHLELDDIANEDIVCMEEVSLSAVNNPLQRALAIHTAQGHTVLCTGAPVQTTDAQFGDAVGYLGNFQASRVNFKCGGVGPGAHCETPYGTFWAGADDIWCLPTGNPVPVRVGTNIRPALQACPPSLRRFWSMAYADGVLYLAIATVNSEVAGPGAFQVMYPAAQHWRLDLYDGLPTNPTDAQWYGPQDYEGLKALAGGDTVLPNAAPGGPCVSIVTREVDGHATIVGACQAASNAGASRTFFISYNEDSRAFDVPYTAVGSALPWTASNDVAIGDLIRPSILATNGRLYRAQNTGRTNLAEPTWPLGAGSTVNDNGVVWEEIRGTTFWNRTVTYAGATVTGEVLMDVKFKDDDWGSPNRDKILRRIDINALMETRVWTLFWAVLNQGDRVGNLGPVVLGDASVRPGSGLTGARNTLGIDTTDTMRASSEFQSKTYKPKTPTTGSPSLTQPLDVADNGIIRARTIQPNFLDLSGIVIDDTNDYISWVEISAVNQSAINVFTAQLTHQYYANMLTLLAEITVQMNLVQTNTLTGFTLAASSWNASSPFGKTFPYLLRFNLSWLARTGATYIAFIHGDYNPETAITRDDTTLLGVTCYPSRTQRLLAILGIDTSLDAGTALGFGDIYADGSAVIVAPETISPLAVVSPSSIWATEFTPYTRPSPVRIGALDIEAAVLPGLPLSNRNK